MARTQRLSECRLAPTTPGTVPLYCEHKSCRDAADTKRCEGCDARRPDHENPEGWYEDTLLTPDGPMTYYRCPECW